MPGENKITYFGKTDYRNRLTPFGIKAQDRTRHVYVIGKTGMGKSTLLENMAAQDLQNGEGMGFIDPHGGTAELLLDYIPEHRIKDVIYFAPFDTDYPVAFNIMEDVGKDKRHLVASGLMSAFKKIWVDAWSARMEYILGNTLLALLEFPGATLLGVNRMYSDKDYRKKVVDNITDPSIKSFWVDEYAKYGDRYTQEATPAIQNKVGQFVSNPLIRNIIGQSKSTFDIRDVMDSKKILIMNLSKGKVGDQNTSLLGSMLITKIYLAAMSRADVSREEMSMLPNFYFFVDEFQSFANESFADILSEARKYKLNLTIAHQYIEQMPEEVRAAVFGNVGTMITFRVGSYDADVLEKEFLPAFSAEDIVNLDKYQMYLRLMIDGVGSKPFSAIGLPPISKEGPSFKDKIIAHSRAVFARKREDVEQEILDWHKTSFADKKPEPAPTSASGVGTVSHRGSETPARNFPHTQAGAPESRAVSNRPAYQPRESRYDTPRNFPPREVSSGVRPVSRVRETPPSSDRHQFEHRHEEPSRASDHFERGKTVREHVSYRELPSEPVISRTPAPSSTTRTEEKVPSPAHTPVSFTPAATVSLSSLKKDHGEKGASETVNKNQLKEALQSLMKEKPTTPHPQPQKEEPKKNPPPVEKTSTEHKQPHTVSTSQGFSPKEIPEDVLRGMLKVEE